MEQLNKVELRGIVGSVRTQKINEVTMARFCVATNYAYKDREGYAVIDTSWHNVTAWEGRNIQNLEKLSKGAKVHLFGRIRYQTYTGADGVDRTSTDILVSKLEILDQEEPMQYEA